MCAVRHNEKPFFLTVLLYLYGSLYHNGGRISVEWPHWPKYTEHPVQWHHIISWCLLQQAGG